MMRSFVLIVTLVSALLSTTQAIRVNRWRQKCGRWNQSCYRNSAGQCLDSRGNRCGSAQGSVDIFVRQ